MRDLAAATIVAKSHLPYARVLADSFRRYHPDVPFLVLLADEIDGCFDPAEEPFELLSIRDLGIPQLKRFLFRYAKQELSYAATPYLISALLDRSFRRVAFFKQESLVTGDLTSVLELIGPASIVLTPHLLEPLEGADRSDRELNILQSGVYNVGFIGVAGTIVGRAFLTWWQSRMAHHCVRDVASALHFEQRWLDLVPSYFDDYVYVRDPRFNVGHWNLPERAGPATFVRFSGFDPEHPEALTRYTPRLHLSDIQETASLFRAYAGLLNRADFAEANKWPYAYDRLEDGELIPQGAREAYRQLSDDEADAFGDPWLPLSENAFLQHFMVDDRRRRGIAARTRKVWRKHRDRGLLRATAAVLKAAWRKMILVMKEWLRLSTQLTCA